VITGKGHIKENLLVNQTLGAIVNAARSTPFIILMVAIIPFTRIIAGTSIGTNAAIVPLSIAAIPFVARIVESALKEVDDGLIEAAQSMGASPGQIILKVLIPEAMPSIVLGLTLTVISLIGYSAMAGAIGGGGLGDLAIRYGYQRFRADVMIATVVILIAMVQIVQSSGDYFARKLNKR
jgi:D-methionine transport system permease protein